jgi:hypothetical protein
MELRRGMAVQALNSTFIGNVSDLRDCCFDVTLNGNHVARLHREAVRDSGPMVVQLGSNPEDFAGFGCPEHSTG